MKLHYGNHPYGTLRKRDVPRRKSIAPAWRTSDGGRMPEGTPRAAFYRAVVA